MARSSPHAACVLALSVLVGCGGPDPAEDPPPRTVVAEEETSHTSETPQAADREADAPEVEPTPDDECVLEVPERRHASIPSLEVPVRGRVARTCARIEREARARLPRDIPDGWRALEGWAAARNTEEPHDPRDPPSERLRRFAGRFGRCVGAGGACARFLYAAQAELSSARVRRPIR